MEDEETMEASLATYKSQLSQVELSLESADAGTKDDLVQLKSDLQQLIQLTEESLLSLKKSRLLASLDAALLASVPSSSTADNTSCSNGDANQETFNMDAEFAAFQSAIAADTRESVQEESGSQEGMSELDDDDDDDSDDDDDDDYEDEVSDLSGMKCRAPYTHSWGEMSFHNAIISSILPNQSQVRVLYVNPTHSSMRPCPYFLEGKCRYDSLHCRYSHGELVSVDDLQPFLDPDYSQVLVGSPCLARDSDDLWYHATVVDLLDDGRYHVMFDLSQCEAKLDANELFPLHDVSCSDSQPDNDDSINDDRLSAGVPDDEEELPVYLWRPGQTTDVIGEWEKHTRGVGSRIMARMGYVVGQGLGKHCEGRAEPVTIQLLPHGKSLDKIMELKQLAGDRDLYDIMRRQKHRQKVVDAKAAKAYVSGRTQSQSSGYVFDIINRKLNPRKTGSVKGLTKSSSSGKKALEVKHISTHELEKKSNKHLNIQLCKTSEELRNAEREVARLRTALERNEKQDRLMAKQIAAKLSTMEEYITQLQTSQSFIKQQQKARHARDQLTKF